MLRFIIATSLVIILQTLSAQQMPDDSLPYVSIGEYPTDYEPGSILARYLDGLGYRYHWATRNLREQDLAYRPSADASSAFETLEHIYNLSLSIRNVASNMVNERSPKEEMSYVALRAATLENFQLASKQLVAKTADEIAALSLQYRQRDGEIKHLDFWLAINGQMSDALYHVGQIVSFRRTSGNPMHPGVSVFRGQTQQ